MNLMRKIVAWLYMSLDGVVESPETWAFSYINDEIAQASRSGMAAADTLLLGRRTYQEFAAYWPNQSSEVEFADYLNNIPKLVASTTLKSVEWRNSTLIMGDLAEELRRLKQKPGKNIGITGSATLVWSLLRDGLLDELQILVFPIVVGAGRHLFEDGRDQVVLKLLDTKTFSTGVVLLTYEPAGK